jgi:hypothetical protein
VEIQEMLCTDITRGEQQCQNLAEEYESEIETWWKQQDDYPGNLQQSMKLMANRNDKMFFFHFKISSNGSASTT